MNSFAVSALLNLITSVALIIIIASKGKRRMLEGSFVAFCLSVAVWSAFYMDWQMADNPIRALSSAKGLMMGAIFCPVTFFHYASYLTGQEKKNRWIIWTGYPLSVLLAWANTGSWVVSGLRSRLFFEFWPEPGPLFHLHLLMFTTYCGLFVLSLLRGIKGSPDEVKARIKLVLIFSVIGFGGGMVNYILWYGIPIPPYTTGAVSLFMIGAGYGIFRHQIVDLSQTLGGWLRLLFFSIFISLPILFVLKVSFSWISVCIAVFSISIITPLFYECLKEPIAKAVDRLPPFRGFLSYEHLRDHINRLDGPFTEGEWAQRLLEGFKDLLGFSRASVWMKSLSPLGFQLKGAVGDCETQFIPLEHKLIASFEKKHDVLVSPPYDGLFDLGEASNRDSFWKNWDCVLAVPFFSRNQLVAFALFGSKESGCPYNELDVTILRTVSRQIGKEYQASFFNGERDFFLPSKHKVR